MFAIDTELIDITREGKEQKLEMWRNTVEGRWLKTIRVKHSKRKKLPMSEWNRLMGGGGMSLQGKKS